MKEIVDLYAKLVIGTFTFIGPSFTLLISLFYSHLNRAESRNRERIKTLADLGKPKALKKQILQSEREENLLRPKRQVIRLFSSLLGSLTLIAFYYFQHTHFWEFKYAWARVATLILSIALYAYCMICLWQVFCTIINAKLEEESLKHRPLLQTS